jgi:hypothetical protein
MSNTVTIGFSLVPSTISHFRWVWDSNPWDPLMLEFLLPPHKQTLPLIILKLKKTPYSLNGFNTSTNRSMRFCKNLMLTTSTAMINTGYHTNFRLEIKSGYICKRNFSPCPIGIFSHFVMGLTLSPRLWVAMILISTLHYPIFNVDLLRAYFPPILDTYEIATQLTPIELNLDFMEQESTDQRVDTQVKGTPRQQIHLY